LPKIQDTYTFQSLLGDNVIIDTLHKLNKTSQRKSRLQANRLAAVDVKNQIKRYWYQQDISEKVILLRKRHYNVQDEFIQKRM